MTVKRPHYGYVAYIDEAGDDGLTRVRPIDPTGSSEWLVVSAVVVSVTREDEVEGWISGIADGLRNPQARNIHFRKLTPKKKLFVCDRLAELPARYFVICSNKKNMKGHRNPLAEKVPSQCWFYCWMTRLLIERITDFVYWRSIKDSGQPQKVKIEYSNRGGLSYSQMHAYYRWISWQGPRTILRLGQVFWQTINFDLLEVRPHAERAGLMLADAVASAFYKACDQYNTGACDPSFAKALRPRMARYRDNPRESPSGYGVKLMPASLDKANLLPEQQEIFRYYGYPSQWWAPDPSDQ